MKNELLEECLEFSHEGRELALMRQKLKPLAVFCVPNQVDENECFDFRGFLNLVEEQAIVYENVQSVDGFVFNGFRYFIFALPDEKWRVNSYKMLLKFLHKHTWSSEMEWISSELLGYSEDQIRKYLTAKYRK